MPKDFDQWNGEKKKLELCNQKVFFRERDVFFVCLGVNIGYEQDGKNKNFSRPIIVLRKFNKNIFLGVPLTTQIKNNDFYFNFFVNNRNNSAILSQIRLIDSKRIVKKIGVISIENFKVLKQKIGKLLKLADF